MSDEAMVFVLDLLLVDLVDWPSPFNFAIAGKYTGSFFGWALLMLFFGGLDKLYSSLMACYQTPTA
jgi:hypothetical protein